MCTRGSARNIAATAKYASFGSRTPSTSPLARATSTATRPPLVESEKIQLRAAAVLGRAQLLHVLRHLVDGELLRRELVGLPLRLGIAELRRRRVVPHAPRRFLAVVLAFDDRQRRDLAPALGADADVHHLGGDLVGAAMRVRAAAVRVEAVHDAAQLARMLARHLLVAAFPDQDRRVVAVVDDDVAERRRPQRPRRGARVRLAVDARLIDDEAEPIASRRSAPARPPCGPSGRSSRPRPSSGAA